MVARFEQSNRNNQIKYKLENSILLLSLPHECEGANIHKTNLWFSAATIHSGCVCEHQQVWKRSTGVQTISR